MLRWLLNLVGLRRERSETRCPKATVKPSVEELEKRTVPSASPTNIMSQLVSTATQVIATAESEVSYIKQMIGQEVAEEIAYVEQQVDRLLGIVPNEQNPALAPTAPQPGSGAGSGSGATATHNAPNQSLNSVTPKSGGGSGSGAMASHKNSSKQSMLPMTGSGSCGSGSGSGSLPQITIGTGSNVNEGSGSCTPGPAIRNVALNFPVCYTVSVHYATRDGSATAGTDYTAESGTLTFAPGQIGQTITIPILDDGTDESIANDSFYVDLSDPNGATLGTSYVSTINIEEGPQQAATDTLRWNPCMGNNASTVQNWYDVTQGFQLQAGATGPNPSSPIQFDANPADTPNSNAPITWDKSFTVASISLNQYTGQQTTNAGIIVESKGANDTSLSMDGNSWLKVNFGDNQSIFKIDDNATITNMILSGVTPAQGQFDILGGTTMIGESANYKDQIGVKFYIGKSAELDDFGYNTLQLTADPIYINVVGEMIVYYGTGNSMVLIDSGANKDDYIKVYGGTLAFYGTVQWDYFNVPITVQNGGTFIVTAAVNSSLPTLVVKGANATTKNASVYLTGSSSSVQLSKSAILECDSDYYQDSGDLETTDSSECELKDGVGGAGTAKINGGRVIVDEDQNTYGKLDVNAVSLQLRNTTLMVWVEGYKPGNAPSYDLLKVSGTLQGVATCTLLVGVDGTPQNPNTWKIITSGGMGSDFGTKKSDPQTNLIYGPINMPENGSYQVQFKG